MESLIIIFGLLLLCAWWGPVSFLSTAFSLSRPARVHQRGTAPPLLFVLQQDWQQQQQQEETAAKPIRRRRKKKKKNKYEQFSKVKGEELDPFEQLLAESEQKNKELERVTEEEKRTTRPTPEIAPLPKMEFPDTRHIDPYDPQTFGYLEIGNIVGAHGVHGWIKVQCATDFPVERLCQAGIRHLKPAKKRAPRQVVLLQGKHRHGDEYLVQLQDVETREDALKLRGSMLYVRQEQKAIEQKHDEYLVEDLVGMEVFLVQDEEDDRQFVGKVGSVVFAEDLCSVPGLGHDYLELVLPRGTGGTASFRDELVLVPMVPQIVPTVDLKGGAVYIDPPAGLLDLTYVREEKTRIKGFLPSASKDST